MPSDFLSAKPLRAALIVVIDVTLIAEYEAVPNQIERKEIVARVIREIAPYDASPDGQWGVNPTSTLREIDLN